MSSSRCGQLFGYCFMHNACYSNGQYVQTHNTAGWRLKLELGSSWCAFVAEVTQFAASLVVLLGLVLRITLADTGALGYANYFTSFLSTTSEGAIQHGYRM